MAMPATAMTLLMVAEISEQNFYTELDRSRLTGLQMDNRARSVNSGSCKPLAVLHPFHNVRSGLESTRKKRRPRLSSSSRLVRQSNRIVFEATAAGAVPR